jgi:tRNA1(Val) A37 N6-methylase TrmN6
VASGWKYIGCDTDKVTYGNLLELVKFLGIKEKVTLYNDPPIQDRMHLVPKVDVVLTSPPFYNLENYDRNISEEYSTYEMWRDEFLRPLVEKSLKKLKPGGLSCWNLMNCGGNDLVGDLKKIHDSKNMKSKSTLCVNSPLANIRTLKNKDVTYIFERKS